MSEFYNLEDHPQVPIDINSYNIQYLFELNNNSFLFAGTNANIDINTNGNNDSVINSELSIISFENINVNIDGNFDVPEVIDNVMYPMDGVRTWINKKNKFLI